MLKRSSTLSVIIFLATALTSSNQVRADPSEMRHFTVGQLRAVCTSDQDGATDFCKGFLVSAFETSSIFGTSLGGAGICPNASIDANNLRKLVVGTLGGVSIKQNKQPALAMVIQILQRQYPCGL